MKMRSVMQHSFSQVPKAEIPRSSFDRSHGLKTTIDTDYLIPILVDEALPGDTFNLDMTAFARLATPIFPIIDNLFMDTFFFAVPYRLLWDNWERFNGAQDNPDDSVDFLVPQVELTSALGAGSLGGYFGLPYGVANQSVAAFAFRAYNLIYNEWFRDQNLQDSLPVNTDDGPDDEADYAIVRRGKRHDYFTSCLPWPQKGDSVELPLGTVAPVNGTTNFIPIFDAGATSDVTLIVETSGNVIASAAPGVISDLSWAAGPGNTRLEADLSSATAATINQLRQAFQVQKLLERDARGGTRYTEIVRAHFGVVSPDARLQRPEYLGGGSTPINITPVAQTTPSAGGLGDTPLGNLAGFGTASVHNNGFTKSFTEHCVIIGLVNVRADLTYQQGIERMWSRQTRYDFYWPALAHIGEQAVLNKEIFSSGSSTPDDDVFGYQERYAEYRYKPSRITGVLNSTVAGALDAWHLAQEFGGLPELGAAFIESNTPMERVIAVTDEPHFVMDAYFKMRCARPMPLFGVPGLIDHF